MIYVKHQHQGSNYDIAKKECLGNLHIQHPRYKTCQVVSLEHQLVTQMGECPLSPYLPNVPGPLNLLLQNWSLKFFPCLFSLLHLGLSSCHLPLLPIEMMQGVQHNQGQVFLEGFTHKEV
jgi:hypothetical protein